MEDQKNNKRNVVEVREDSIPDSDKTEFIKAASEFTEKMLAMIKQDMSDNRPKRALLLVAMEESTEDEERRSVCKVIIGPDTLTFSCIEQLMEDKEVKDLIVKQTIMNKLAAILGGGARGES